jgi:CheY-like chemotaxis protein
MLFQGKKFLVVDDEPDLREILRDELEFAGATLSEAENGVIAFDLATKSPFDAVISDIRMPGGDGMTLAKKLKEQSGHRPVVFMVTGFADFTPSEAYELGVEGFIYKPFNLGPVIENLSRALEAPALRWSHEPPKTAAKNMQLPGSLTELLNSGKLKLGTGGVFVEGTFGDLRKDENLKVTLGDGCVLTTVVRWTQGAEPERKLPAGAGLEIICVNKESLAAVVEQIQKKAPVAFIPRR